MDRNLLRRLELLNQLSLTETEKDEVISFFAKRDEETSTLNGINTENIERMVHVMPIETVVREDEVKQPFSRDELQKDAPEVDEGYWCVPRVLE